MKILICRDIGVYSNLVIFTQSGGKLIYCLSLINCGAICDIRMYFERFFERVCKGAVTQAAKAREEGKMTQNNYSGPIFSIPLSVVINLVLSP